MKDKTRASALSNCSQHKQTSNTRSKRCYDVLDATLTEIRSTIPEKKSYPLPRLQRNPFCQTHHRRLWPEKIHTQITADPGYIHTARTACQTFSSKHKTPKNSQNHTQAMNEVSEQSRSLGNASLRCIVPTIYRRPFLSCTNPRAQGGGRHRQNASLSLSREKPPPPRAASRRTEIAPAAPHFIFHFRQRWP